MLLRQINPVLEANLNTVMPFQIYKNNQAAIKAQEQFRRKDLDPFKQSKSGSTDPRKAVPLRVQDCDHY